MTEREFADALRSWRQRAAPPPAGFGARRVPGLRREELAERAGISIDYLVQLEQGRATRPSSQVVGSLARALALQTSDRDALFAAAGLLAPGVPRLPLRVGPVTRRLVERTTETPIAVFSRAWDVLLANELWEAIFGSVSGSSLHERNIIWQHVVAGRHPVIYSVQEHDAFTRRLMWDLRRETARHPADSRLADLHTQLQAHLEFDPSEPPPGPRRSDREKTVRHPQVGQITFNADVLVSPDDDTQIMLYTVAPRSADARNLAVLKEELSVGQNAAAG